MTYQEIIDLFEQRLTIANLKESTIFIHVDNMRFFFECYLGIPLSKPIHKSDTPSFGIGTINDFFSGYYIDQCDQACKTDLSRYLGTMKKFYSMLQSEGYISLAEKKDLFNLIKANKEKWLYPFALEYELEEDWFDPRNIADFFPDSVKNPIQEAIDGLLTNYSPLKKVIDLEAHSLDHDSVITQIMKQYNKDAKQFEFNLIKKVYQEIFSFEHNYQPWKFITNTDLFAIEHPSLSDRYYIGVLGNGGLEFGINLYRGDDNIPNLINMMNSIYELDTEASANYTMYMISLDTKEFAWPADIQLQKSSGFSFSSSHPYPTIRKLSKGKSMLGISSDDLNELSILLPLVNSLLRTMIANQSNIGSYRLSHFLLRKYSSSASYADTVHSVSTIELLPQRPLLNDISIAQAKKLKIQKNFTLEIDAFHLGHFIKLDKDFVHPLLFVCAGFSIGDIYHSEIFKTNDTLAYAKLIQDDFLNLLLQTGQLPKSISLRKNSYLDGIIQVCELLAISVIYIDEYSMISELKYIGKSLLE